MRTATTAHLLAGAALTYSGLLRAGLDSEGAALELDRVLTEYGDLWPEVQVTLLNSLSGDLDEGDSASVALLAARQLMLLASDPEACEG